MELKKSTQAKHFGNSEGLASVVATLPPPKVAEFEFIRYKLEGEVARLTLDRPEHNLLI